MNGRMKYFIIIIVSGLLIIAEAMAYFLFVRPGMKLDDFFAAAEAGSYEEMASNYDELNDDDRDEAVQILKDMSVSLTNKYLDSANGGLDAYTELDNDLFPIVEIAEKLRTEGDERAFGLAAKLADCYYHANNKALAAQLDKCAEEVAADSESQASKDAIQTFKDIFLLQYGEKGVKGRVFFDFNGIQDDYRAATSAAVTQYLEQKYQEFFDGKIKRKVMSAYLSVVDSVFEQEEKNGLRDIQEQFSEAEEYSHLIAECEGRFATKEYVEIIEDIDAVMAEKKDDPLLKRNEDVLKQQRNEAYKLGKEEYPDILYNIIKEGKLDEAKALYERIEKIYGTDIELPEAKSFLKNDWKMAYYDYMQKWEENLKAAVEEGIGVGNYNNSADINFATNKPDLMALRDLDGDGKAEMILFKSRTSYSYILTCIEGRVVLTGCLKVSSYSNEKCYIISEPYSGNAGMASQRKELNYFDAEDGRIYTVRSVYRNRDYSYVYIDGMEYNKDGSSDDGSGGAVENNTGASPAELYDRALKEIEDYSDGGNAYPDPAGSVTVSRYFECIYNYTGETAAGN